MYVNKFLFLKIPVLKKSQPTQNNGNQRGTQNIEKPKKEKIR
jgi:hypothetical protein